MDPKVRSQTLADVLMEMNRIDRVDTKNHSQVFTKLDQRELDIIKQNPELHSILDKLMVQEVRLDL